MTALRIRRYGERAVFAELSAPLAAEQPRIVALSDRAHSLPGVVDAVAGDGNCTVFASDAAHVDGIADALARLWDGTQAAPCGPVVDIEVRYGNEYGEDFAAVCSALSLSADELIALHASCEYTVQFLGYRPGFAYLAQLPERLHLPRRTVPRTRVPEGSVAIAASMTSVYPSAAPGGWHLIGRTTATLFDARRDPPSLLQPGMRVRFIPL